MPAGVPCTGVLFVHITPVIRGPRHRPRTPRSASLGLSRQAIRHGMPCRIRTRVGGAIPWAAPRRPAASAVATPVGRAKIQCGRDRGVPASGTPVHTSVRAWPHGHKISTLPASAPSCPAPERAYVTVSHNMHGMPTPDPDRGRRRHAAADGSITRHRAALLKKQSRHGCSGSGSCGLFDTATADQDSKRYIFCG